LKRITEAREVNAEPIPLEDGDMIRFGANAAYRVEFLVDYDTEAQFLSEIQAIHSETEAQKRRKFVETTIHSPFLVYESD